MTRSLSGTMETEVAKTITKPVYLINIDDTYHYSSGPQVSYGGDTYTIHDIKVTNLDPDKNKALIHIGSTDLSIVSIVLAGIAGLPIQIHKHYGGETETLIDGVGSDVGLDERWTKIRVVDGSVSYQRAPRIYYNDYLLDHLPQRGQVVRWGGEVFTIEKTAIERRR